jgi:hypothetical protein
MVPDISKALISLVIHPRLFSTLAGLVPGLFLELSVLAANPAPIHRILEKAGLGYSTSVVVALFLGFVLGSAALLWVNSIQIAFGCACKLVRKLERDHSSESDSVEGAKRVWGRAAVALMRQTYGIEPPKGDGHFHQVEVNAWYQVLAGSLRPEDLRGSLFVITMHATGWCGIAAVFLASSLHSAGFMGLSLFLIVFGMLHDLNVARWWTSPAKVAVTKARAVLAEIKATRTEEADSGLGTGTINPGEQE